MGAGASVGIAAAVKTASPQDLEQALGKLPEDARAKLAAALSASDVVKKPDDPEPEKKPAVHEPDKKPAGPPPMEKLDAPFGTIHASEAVDIKDDPTHKIRFEDDEGCVRVYEPFFDKPGQTSEVHYHDQYTAYLFMGHPDEKMTESAMEICQEIEGGGIKSIMSVKMPAFRCGSCSCLSFPHPQFGEKLVHRVGIPADFAQAGQPFHQLGCEVKAWPKAATIEALPSASERGPSLPPPYAKPLMAADTSKFRTWYLELRPGAELPAHSFSSPAMVLCGCGGGGKLAPLGDDGPSESPLLGLERGAWRWLPTGCATVGPLKLADDAHEPFVVAVVELLRDGFS